MYAPLFMRLYILLGCIPQLPYVRLKLTKTKTECRYQYVHEADTNS